MSTKPCHFEIKNKIERMLNSLPEVTWDRWGGEIEEYSMFFGWIERDDGRFDFLDIRFHEGEPWAYATSSAKYSESYSERILGGRGDGHSDCKRVEDYFLNVKAVKLISERPSSDAAKLAILKAAKIAEQFFGGNPPRGLVDAILSYGNE